MEWVNKVLSVINNGLIKITNIFSYEQNNLNLIVEKNDISDILDLLHRQEERLLNQVKLEYQREAREIGSKNTYEFMYILAEVLRQNDLSLDIAKFSKPDFQEVFNLAIKGAYINGSKTDLNTLARLISRRATSSDTDLQTMTIDDAISVVPKLNKKHISFLTFILLFKSMTLNNITKLNDYEFSCKLFSEIIPDLREVTPWDIQYLESQRCLQINAFGDGDFIEHMKNVYPESPLSKFTNEELSQQILESKNLNQMVKIYNNDDLAISRLRATILGQMIASTNAKKYSPDSIDFDNFIK